MINATNKPDAIVEKLEKVLNICKLFVLKHPNDAEAARVIQAIDTVRATLKQPATIDEAVVERCAETLYNSAMGIGTGQMPWGVYVAKMPIDAEEKRTTCRAVLTAAGFKMEGK